MSFDLKNLLVIGSRLLGILSRYLFFLLFGKYLSSELFSQFNLVSSLVVYLIFFAGFDYYNHLHRNYYSNREVFLEHINKYFFIFFVGIFVGVILSISFLQKFGDIKLIGVLIFIIGCSELLLQESYRFEILKGNIFTANFFAFIRYLWMIIYLFCLYGFNIVFDIESLLLFWASVNFLLAVMLVSLYYEFRGKISFKNLNILDTLGSINSIFPLFLSTLILRAFFLFDRWFPQFMGTTSYEIAIYSLLALAGSGFTIIIDTILVNFYYPLLIKSSLDNATYYRILIREFFYKLLVISAISLLALLLGFEWIDEFSYSNYKFSKEAILFALLSQIFFNFSIIPNLILFNLKKDRIILFSNLFSFLVFVGVLFINRFILNELNAVTVFKALTISFGLLFFLKTYFSRSYGYKIY